MDNIIKSMKYNDDDYDDDEYYDDEDDIREEPVRGKRSSIKTATLDDDDEFEDRPLRRNASAPSRPAQPSSSGRKGSNRLMSNGMEVCVIKPTAFEDAKEITETLLENRTVVLNIEGLDMNVAQRIIDFTSGSTFAIEGNLQMISNYIYLVTPKSVEISGDFQEALAGKFDVPALRNRF